MAEASNVKREDKGCEYFPKCSQCGFPEGCKDEVPGLATRLRNEAIVKACETKSVEEVAAEFNRGPRAIQRVLKKYKECKDAGVSLQLR